MNNNQVNNIVRLQKNKKTNTTLSQNNILICNTPTRTSRFFIEKWNLRELSLPKRREVDKLQRKFHGQCHLEKRPMAPQRHCASAQICFRIWANEVYNLIQVPLTIHVDNQLQLHYPHPCSLTIVLPKKPYNQAVLLFVLQLKYV